MQAEAVAGLKEHRADTKPSGKRLQNACAPNPRNAARHLGQRCGVVAAGSNTSRHFFLANHPISIFPCSRRDIAYRRAMALTRLSLSDFRNHSDAILSPGTGFVVLTGDNGAGKTNILEAVSLLAPGRGLRRAALPAMARQGGAGGFGVAADLDGGSLATGIDPVAPERRIIRINGTTRAANDLSEWLSIVWLTPAMDRIFNDSAGDRRRFFDRLVLAIEPSHARHAARYEAAMRQRNRLLAGDSAPDPAWLSALEAQMAEHGLALALARSRLVELLNTGTNAQPAGPFPHAHVALEGWEGSDLAAELRMSRARDAAAGRTLCGPHRADLIVTHIAKQQHAALCSTGEQKALLLGVILAHAALVAAQTGRPPLLLLDEVAAHLDPLRRAALFDRLAATGSQVWMTGTEPGLFEAIDHDASHFNIRDGQII